MYVSGTQIVLRTRPVIRASLENFELVTMDVDEPEVGQVIVKNNWMSVDPYMRGRMDDTPSYIRPFELHVPLEGGAIGTVVASRAEGVSVGSTVSHFAGWRSHALLDATAVTVLDAPLIDSQHYLGLLGTTGLSAYVATTEIAPVRQGDVVFVSAAAGAVGSIAGQLARMFGASRVVGSAGGPSKGRHLVDGLGFDAAIDYRAGDIPGQLAAAAPDGIDVYIDLVGGGHLDAAIGAMRVGGRIALVGAISAYQERKPLAMPADFYRAYTSRLMLRGMLINDHMHRFPEWIPIAVAGLADGNLSATNTIVDGLQNAPAAFLSLFAGANTGKLLVRLGD
jgi:NADPH-dependent curcumin reductase CurA